MRDELAYLAHDAQGRHEGVGPRQRVRACRRVHEDLAQLYEQRLLGQPLAELLALKVVPRPVHPTVGDVARDIAAQVACAAPTVVRVVVFAALVQPVVDEILKLRRGQHGYQAGVVLLQCDSSEVRA
ncbi:hypothetical protein D3C86_1742750 [compost metagenome]